MLASILVWLYAGLLSLIYGLFSILLLNRLFFRNERPVITVSLPVIVILGLVVLTTIASILSLWIQIGLVANLLLLFGAFLIVFLQRKSLAGYLSAEASSLQKANPFIWLFMAVMFLVILARSTELPYNYDTGLYHGQAIHWFEEYRVIPGLGNIFKPLAFLNSSWFITSTLFSFSFLGYGSFHHFGAFLSLLFVSYALVKSNRLIQGEVLISNLASLLAVFFLRRFFLVQLSSPGTDLPAALFIWLIFILSMEKIEKKEEDQFNLETLLILIFSIFVLTVKLSILPILILPLYFLIREIFNINKSAKILVPAIAIFLLAPWLIRGFILSGYLVFPVFQIDLFKVDWKIPNADVKNYIAGVVGYARIPRKDINIVMKMSFTQWIPSWCNWQNSFNRQLYYLIGTGIPLLAITTILYARKYKSDRPAILRHLIIFITAILGVAYWFIEAPKAWYGYGFLIITVCILISPFIKWFLDKANKFQKLLVYLLLIGSLSYWGIQFYKTRDLSQFQDRILLPVDYPQPPVKLQNWDNTMIFFVPTTGEQCYYYAFPCVPVRPSGVIKRTSNLLDGFMHIPSH